MDQEKLNNLLERLKQKDGEPPNPAKMRLRTALLETLNKPTSPPPG